MSFWPTPANMVCALGPGDQVIDIRAPGEYERWHGFQGLSRDGLSCLDCLGAVNPRMVNKTSSAARPILVHSPIPGSANADDKCESVRSMQRGAGWKKLLKKLMAQYLRQLGHEAVVDPATDGERIDLLTHAGSRRIAIRVELDKLKADEFKGAQRKLAMQEKNTELLWITFGCSWVDRATAVGIRFVDESPLNGAIDVGGVFPVVDAGAFVPGINGLANAKPVGLGHFLQRFMAGEVQNHPVGGERRGWARTSAWDLHIRHLERARLLGEQQRLQLEKQLDEAKRANQEEMRALELKALTAEGRAARAESETARERERVVELEGERDREMAHRDAATAWGAEIEKSRDTSAVSRIGLRRHPAFTYPPSTGTSAPEARNDWGRRARASSPWVIATLTLMAPLLGIVYLVQISVLTPTGVLWSQVALTCLALLPAIVGLWVDGQWCWALDNSSKLRGHRRADGFLRRCGRREHSLNLFDAWLLLSIFESAALVSWIVARFS